METSYIRMMSIFPILVQTPLIFPIPWAPPGPIPKRGVKPCKSLTKYPSYGHVKANMVLF